MNRPDCLFMPFAIDVCVQCVCVRGFLLLHRHQVDPNFVLLFINLCVCVRDGECSSSLVCASTSRQVGIFWRCPTRSPLLFFSKVSPLSLYLRFFSFSSSLYVFTLSPLLQRWIGTSAPPPSLYVFWSTFTPAPTFQQMLSHRSSEQQWCAKTRNK